MSVIRKMLYFSWGAVSMSRDKAEKFISEMVKKGEISREEAKKYVDDLIQKGEEEKKEIRNLIREEIEEIKKDFSFARRADLDALEKRVLQLEEKQQ